MNRLKVSCWFRNGVLAFLGLACVAPDTWAQLAQLPLMGAIQAAPPNVMLILDDSDSMAYWDSQEPPTNGSKPRCSSLNNSIYYNPANVYLPPLKADGTREPQASLVTPIKGIISSQGKYQQACANVASTYIVTTPGGPSVGSTTATFPYYTTRVNGQWVPTYLKPVDYYLLAFPVPTPVPSRFPKPSSRTDCVTSASYCTYTEEYQNFVNWYQYYSTRIRMTSSALREAFATVPLNKFRLGWARINADLYPKNNGTPLIKAGVHMYDAAARDQFLNFLTNDFIETNTIYGTPNIRAVSLVGDYFQRRDSDGPWGTNPISTTTTVSVSSSYQAKSREAPSSHSSCRRSFAILVTDGLWTDGRDSPLLTVGNVDGASGPQHFSPFGPPGGYVRQAPYADDSSNTLADTVMRLWSIDLRPDLENEVPPMPGTDPAFWQHLNFSAITLNLDGTLPRTSATLAGLQSGSIQWPQPLPNSVETVDDTWHATINGHGSLINVRDSVSMSAAMSALLGGAISGELSQSGVAVIGQSLSTRTKKFVPSFTAGDWSGNLTALMLDRTTGLPGTQSWAVETVDPGTRGELANTLGAYSTRNIVVGTGNAAGARAVPFTRTSIVNNGLLPPGQMLTQAQVNYLRGDRSLEGVSMRTRRLLLGDIINSTPQFIGDSVNRGYSKLPSQVGGLPSGSAQYSQFLTQMTKRGEGALFVGANDGMLHAFAENDGREVFAFVPNAVLPALKNLTDNSYTHQYFVDGPMNEGQYYDGTSGWEQVVVGTTGAGAKSVFALRVSSPVMMQESDVLWEVTSKTAGFGDLGYVLNNVQTGLLPNGQWAAIFGGGFYGNTGKAILYVVNLRTGGLIRAIDAPSSAPNGLGGVQLVLNEQMVIVGAYAGDLNGNLWKFNLSNSDPSAWGVDLGGHPLFVAKNAAGEAQPITAPPLAVPHPNGGTLVVAGTGRLLVDADKTSGSVQSLYGLWDPAPFGVSSSASSIADRSALVAQSVSTIAGSNAAAGATATSQGYFTISPKPIDWAVKRGWYLDLPQSGQRMIYPVLPLYVETASHPILEFQTVVPQSLDSAADPCIASASLGYNYIIDAVQGGSPQAVILDTNGDGNIDSQDYFGASGFGTIADGRDASVVVSVSFNKDVRVAIQNTVGGMRVNLQCSLFENCRKFTGAYKRNFRYLYMH